MKWLLIMALNLVGQFYIHSTLNFGFASPFLDNRTVKTYWNDVSNAFEVKIYDTAGTLVAEPTTGPTVLLNPYSRQLQCYTKFFQYCVGADLHIFHPKTGQQFGTGFNPQTGEFSAGGNFLSGFPYAARQIDQNHWSCNIHVCDLEFDLTHTSVTNDGGSGNGTITVKANSSGGEIRFTRDPNAAYADATPSVSGEHIFTGLSSGTYTIYAIDEHNCRASLVVNVPGTSSVYATRWRLQYKDLIGFQTRVDIEQRGFFGFLNGDFESGLDGWNQIPSLIYEDFGLWAPGAYLGDASLNTNMRVNFTQGDGDTRDSNAIEQTLNQSELGLVTINYSIRSGAQDLSNAGSYYGFTRADLIAVRDTASGFEEQVVVADMQQNTSYTGSFQMDLSYSGLVRWFVRLTYNLFENITNGHFVGTLDPSTSEGAGNSWVWTGAFSGAAYNELPASLSPTARLRIPFVTEAGKPYGFELTLRTADGGGGAGAYTHWRVYLTDGVDYSNVGTFNQNLGTEIISIGFVGNGYPYIEITAEANHVNGQLREVLVLLIKAIAPVGDFYGFWEFDMLEFQPESDEEFELTYVKGSGRNPFNLQGSALAEVNIFTPIEATVAVIDLISETDFMFLDVASQDERKFRIKKYKDTGTGLSLKWMGFALPMAHSEPYFTDRNYPVQITANDQIGNLKDLDFTDDSGNVLVGNISFLDAICTILRKTDILLDVRESVNIFETTMDMDPEDSALQQAFFDASIYLGKNCEDVLTSILTNWGARLYQAEGYWNVELIEQRGSSTITYRVFDVNGQYLSNGTYSAVTNIKRATETNRAVLRDRSGLISITPSYGKLKFNIKTSFRNNLLTRGTFEQTDLVNNQILGWTFDVTNGSGVSYGIEDLETPRGDSKSALYIDFSNVSTEKEIIVQAESFNLGALNGPALTFKFDVLFRPYYKEIFSYIDISIKIGDNWVVQSFTGISNSTVTLLDGEYNRYYIDSPLEWKTIEQKIYSSRRQYNTELEGPVVIKIRVNNNVATDFASISALRAQVTDDPSVQANLTRVKVQDGSVLRLYTLNSGTDSDNSPSVIRPDDYNGSTNTYVWKLDKTTRLPEEDYLLAGLLIDNVVLSLDSNYPEDVILEKLIDKNIKPTFDLELNHADLLISELSSVSADENTLRLSKSFIRKNDGFQTVLWKRSYEDEARPLIDILLRMYQSQVTLPAFKLSGSFQSDLYPSMFNSFYDPRLGKYFLPVSLNTRDTESAFDAELIELRTGPNGEPPTPDTYEFTEEHTTEFDA